MLSSKYSSFEYLINYWMTSLFGKYMWRHERQVFIIFGTLNATIKIQTPQKNTVINKIFLTQQIVR